MIDRAFKKLGNTVGKKPIRKSARAAARIFASKIKQNVPVKTGSLKKAVKVRTLKAKRGSILIGATTGDPRSTNLNSGEQFSGGFVEYGRKGGGWHKGSVKEQPFIRPAFESEKTKANKKAVEVLATEINKEM